MISKKKPHHDVHIVMDETYTPKVFSELLYVFVLWMSLKIFKCPEPLIPFIHYSIGLLILLIATRVILWIFKIAILSRFTEEEIDKIHNGN